MTNTYALGINETNADTHLWIKVDGPDNEIVFTSFAEALKSNVEGSFAVADVIANLKADHLKILAIYVDSVPTVDHTPHLFSEADLSVTLFDKESGDYLVTRGIESWAGIYGVRVTVPDHGISVH